MTYGKQLLGATLLCATLGACSEDDTNDYSQPNSAVGLTQSVGSSREGSGLQQVAVRLDAPQAGKTFVSFRLSGNATVGTSAYTHPDVQLLTESPVVIEAGETEAIIRFDVREDSLFEAVSEQFTITLGGVLKGNAQLDARQTTYTHTIEENDYELTLSWESDSPEAGKTTPSVADLDLIVEHPNNVYLFSNSKEGREKLLLTDVAERDHYRVNVWYYRGQADVRYTLTYRAADLPEKVLTSGVFAHDQASEEFDAQNSAVRTFRLVPDGKLLNVQ